MVEVQRIERCRSCGSSDIEMFLELGNMPLSDRLTESVEKISEVAEMLEPIEATEPKYPLDVALCGSCSLVQILHTVPPDELFCREYPYYSSFAESLLEHSKRNAHRLVAERVLSKKSMVVELASNDGYMLQYFAELGVQVLGIDPAIGPATVAAKKGIRTLNHFFGRDLATALRSQNVRADVVIANNVLAHVPDLNGVVAGIGTILKRDGVAVIEVPYVKDLVDQGEFDTIYHEHLCYFSVTALRELFSRHKLFLNHVEHYPIHGGSLRIYVERYPRQQESVDAYLEMERGSRLHEIGYYQGLSAQAVGIRLSLGRMLRDIKAEGKRIAAYGAAAKGTILLNYCGIDQTLIDFVVDRNIHKQGLCMPGVGIPIGSPERLLEEMPEYVLILPWNFKDEIIAQQHEYLRRGGRFIVPIPMPEVISNEG